MTKSPRNHKPSLTKLRNCGITTFYTSFKLVAGLRLRSERFHSAYAGHGGTLQVWDLKSGTPYVPKWNLVVPISDLGFMRADPKCLIEQTATDVFRVKQAVHLLSVSQSKGYQLVDQGKIGHYRIDGAIRISQKQIEEI